jgi:hypothetical protein
VIRADRIVSHPESYVVRIYRRDPWLSGRVAGMVEVVATDSQIAFRSLRELQQILSGRDGRLRVQRGGGESDHPLETD